METSRRTVPWRVLRGWMVKGRFFDADETMDLAEALVFGRAQVQLLSGSPLMPGGSGCGGVALVYGCRY